MCVTAAAPAARRRGIWVQLPSRASQIDSLPSSVTPVPMISFMASMARVEPSIPGSAPSTPASAQLGTEPGCGGTGCRSR